MKILKPALILLLICAITAAILGYLNEVTAAPIAQQEAKAKTEAMGKVSPEAKSFEDVSKEDLPAGIDSASIALDDSGAPIGSVVGVTTTGYGGAVKILVGVDTEDKVTGVEILGMNETPGLGANANNPDFKDQFKGKTYEITVVKNGATGENEIDAMTSATITSKAVALGVNNAIQAGILETEGVK